MKNKLFPILIIISLALTAACAPQMSASRELLGEAPVEAPAPAYDMSVASEESARGVFGSGSIPGAPEIQTERLVIKNGTLSIVVGDPVKSMENITNLADELGGFVVSADLRETTLESGAKAPYANITIRVPADSFNLALARIKDESDQLPQSENINSQDVTQEYTDLASRLRNLEATEAQLTKIMEDALRTEDVLSVYNQLVQVREQIEVIKGQMKYYEQSAAMSLISVELVANAAVQPLTIGGWQPVGTARNAVQALINTMKVLGDILIWVLIYLLPILLAIYLVIFLPLSLIWRAIRRRRAQNKRSVIPPTQPSNET